MSGSRRRCCCCNETCPPGAYCTACGQATDEAANYETIISGWGTVDLSPCPYGTCDLSIINGTYSLPWTTTLTPGGCIYELTASLGVDAFACWPTGVDHAVTLRLAIEYGQAGPCVCSTLVTLDVTLDFGSSSISFTYTSGGSYNRAIDCTTETINLSIAQGTSLCNSAVVVSGATAAITKL